MAETSTAQIRAWARAQGLDVADKGRLPAAVLHAWQQAHEPAQPAADGAPEESPFAAPAAAPAVAPPQPSSPVDPFAVPNGSVPTGSIDRTHAPLTREDPSPASGLSVAAFVCALLLGPLGIVLGLLSLRRSASGARALAIGSVALGAAWTILVGGALAGQADRDSSGAVTAAGSVRTEALRIGDCLSDLDEGESTTIDLLPCSQPHAGQVLSTFDLPGGVHPGESEVVRLAEGGCTVRAEEQLPSDGVDYGLFFLYPTFETWALGDREVVCVITGPAGAPLTGSLVTS